MKIKVLPTDTSACGHYRMIWPARLLDDVEVLLPGEGDRLPVTMVDGHVVAVEHPQCDIIVLQRVTARALVEAIPFLQAMGVRVVVEVDDDYASIPPWNVTYQLYHPKSSPDDNWDLLACAAQIADMVVVTTPALARRYGPHGRVRIVPNYVPERYFNYATEPNDVPVVGWAGNLQVHAYDLRVTRGGVAAAVESTGAEFRLVGARDQAEYCRRELGLSELPVATGWFEFDTYPVGISDLDVGIVPLDGGTFNQAKSWLKGLEYAAVGVPFVASPTEPYRMLAETGIGDLAVDRNKDWRKATARLITDESYRAERIEAGLKAALELTIENNAWRFHEAWSCTSI